MFFLIFAIKWALGKHKLLIPHALYSLKRKISSVTYTYIELLPTKYVKEKNFALPWVEEIRAVKVNARFFFATDVLGDQRCMRKF